MDKNQFKQRKEEFIEILESMLVSKKELAKEFLTGKEGDWVKTNDQKTMEAYYVLKDYKIYNDVFGVSTLKSIISLLKSDTRFWSKALRNIANTENKLSFLQTKNAEGYKVLSFILDYCDKSRPWADINELGKIKLCNYDDPRDTDAFHFLRTVLTNNSFLIRYGYYYNRPENKYIKSNTEIRFLPNERNQFHGMSELLTLYLDCISYKDFGNIPFDFDREFESLFSLAKLAKELNDNVICNKIIEFLKDLMKCTGKISNKYNEEFKVFIK